MGYYQESVIKALSDYCKDDIEIVVDLFDYLFSKTGDITYAKAITEICKEHNICSVCNSELEPVNMAERHGDNYTFDEHWTEMKCPNGCEI